MAEQLSRGQEGVDEVLNACTHWAAPYDHQVTPVRTLVAADNPNSAHAPEINARSLRIVAWCSSPGKERLGRKKASELSFPVSILYVKRIEGFSHEDVKETVMVRNLSAYGSFQYVRVKVFFFSLSVAVNILVCLTIKATRQFETSCHHGNH
jgi:hypothetical protein